jgi:hypothetical protein
MRDLRHAIPPLVHSALLQRSAKDARISPFLARSEFQIVIERAAIRDADEQMVNSIG